MAMGALDLRNRRAVLNIVKLWVRNVSWVFLNGHKKMDIPTFGIIRQLIGVGTQLVSLSVFEGSCILSCVSLVTKRCAWTWDPLRPASFRIPCDKTASKDISLHVWNWDLVAEKEPVSPTFLLVIIGSRAWCVHLTDGTIWATSPPGLRLGRPVVFGNKLMGTDDTSTKLTEYALPQFTKVRTIAFQAPIVHMLRPAAHVLIMATSGILSQFYLNAHKWGVKYNLGGKATLHRIRIESNLVLALNKHALFILSLNGQLLGKVSAIHGHIQDFAVVATREYGVDMILVERVQTEDSGDFDGKWIARLAKIAWTSNQVSRAKSGGRWLVGVESRDRICSLPCFHGLITVQMAAPPSSENARHSVSNSVIAFGPGYIRTLHYKDFAPI